MHSQCTVIFCMVQRVSGCTIELCSPYQVHRHRIEYSNCFVSFSLRCVSMHILICKIIAALLLLLLSSSYFHQKLHNKKRQTDRLEESMKNVDQMIEVIFVEVVVVKYCCCCRCFFLRECIGSIWLCNHTGQLHSRLVVKLIKLY